LKEKRVEKGYFSPVSTLFFFVLILHKLNDHRAILLYIP